MLMVFFVLCISGVLSYFTEYTRKIATLHTVFGMLFILAACVHMFNNIKALKHYAKSWLLLLLMGITGLLFYLAVSESKLMKNFVDFGARSKAKAGIEVESGGVHKLIMQLDKELLVSLELKRAKHFWHPQIAVWTEDENGNYLETLFVTKATAKGLFSGGRTKDNFKELDRETIKDKHAFRRVNALPVWSHKRGVEYPDGMMVPSYANPLPDGMTGATPLGNFILQSSVDYEQAFTIKLEINVAFDDNEYYSEFDFADDEIFHNGTGQLGQPSLVFQSKVDNLMEKSYYIMNLEGHGHHSARDGLIYSDVSKLSTALEIVEYIVVGIDKSQMNGEM